MKQFHWKKVKVQRLPASAWGELGVRAAKYTGEFDMGEVLDCFEVKAKSKDAAPKQVEKPKMVSTAVSSQRQQNIGIVLNFLKLKPEALRDALIRMDEKVIPPEQLDSIVKILPQPEELKAINFEKENPQMVKEGWGPVERYVDVVGNQVPDLSKRLTMWIFMNEFDTYQEDLTKDMGAVDGAVSSLIDPKARVRDVFAIVLALGNVLNMGSKFGDCPGYQLGDLGNLAGTKTSDGKSNLLSFIVKHVVDKKPELKDWPEDVRPLSAVQVTSQAVGQSVTSLNQGMRTMKRTMEAKKAQWKKIQEAGSVDPGDCVANEARLLSERLEKFVGQNEAAASAFEQKFTALTEKMGTMATAFCEDPASIDELAFFGQLASFARSWDNAAKDLVRAREREEKLRKKQMEAAATAKKKGEAEGAAGGGAPPAGGAKMPVKQMPVKQPSKMPIKQPSKVPVAAPVPQATTKGPAPPAPGVAG